MRQGDRRAADTAAGRGPLSTLIRHASSGATAAVGPLTVAMIQTTFRALLMTAIGGAPLTPALEPSTVGAAVALPAVTTAADPKHRRAAFASAMSLQKWSLRPLRHPVPLAGLDNAGRSWEAQSRRLRDGLRIDSQNPGRINGRGFVFPPALESTSITLRACGADDAAYPFTFPAGCPENYAFW